DDVICDALLAERDAEIALSPGVRWGATLLPGQAITREDIYNATAITYPAAYRITMSGARLKEILEDIADNLFNPDPYYQQCGDWGGGGGIAYRVDGAPPRGRGVRVWWLLRRDEGLDPGRDYGGPGGGSVNKDPQAPPIWDVVANYIAARGEVAPATSGH